MSKSLFVTPAVEGAVLPNPDRGNLPLNAAGEIVPDNVFWRRRIAAGDVVRGAMPEAEADAGEQNSGE